MTSKAPPPILLCIGGHDPSGGAGIQADAESARAAGVHAVSVISCLTTQDTCGVRHLIPQPADQVEEQCRLILADSKVDAIKVGLLGGSRIVRTLSALAAEHPDIPVVVDPILTSGTGEPVADAALLNQLRKNLLKHCALITPNLPEARALSGCSEPDACARRLLSTGCRWVLVTGTHEKRADVVNRLYGNDGSRRDWICTRLPHEYHGSGCTLASAIAARLARGMGMEDAIDQAQAYTWEALSQARPTGRGQFTPNRLFGLEETKAGTK